VLVSRPTDNSWVRGFMACQGQVVLANYLLAHTQRRGRAAVDSDMELELLKCLKTSLSNKVRLVNLACTDPSSVPRIR
jgi:hypothetical protein